MWTRGARGGALLTVLWLSAALSMIAFALANTVRAEAERAAASLDGVRGYFLAAGAIERALLHIQWGPPYYTPGTPLLVLPFPSGEAAVEIIPESAKISVNHAPPEELYRLLLALGAEPERAREIALAIVDWRTVPPGNAPTAFDHYYSALVPSFRARHASLEEIEELLLVKGMTPELFYGTYVRDREGRLVARGGLRDCVTVYGTGGQVDVNTAEPAVLQAVGLDPGLAAAIVELRRRAPFSTLQQVAALVQNHPAVGRLRIGGNTIFTLRATARLRRPNGELSQERRSLAALVKLGHQGGALPYRVLRWYENVWVR